TCFAQLTIKGRVINHADRKPLANVNVFLKNTTIGDKTSDDGSFTLQLAKSAKYQLIVSFIGFGTYQQEIQVNNDITLPDIEIFTKTVVLKEVSIKFKSDPYRQRNLEWFKDDFLGTSELAKECKILNPHVLDLSYDETSGTLTASSYDFLVIENRALGYKVKYLLTNFTRSKPDNNTLKIHFDGSILFEELKGSPSQEEEWKRRREDVYEGSFIHFLRAAVSDKLEQEGFRVLQYANYYNPKRPPEDLITSKIKQFEILKSQGTKWSDSLTYWQKMSRLPGMLREVRHYPLNMRDLIKPVGEQNMYALGCDYDALHITYNKQGRFSKHVQTENLDNIANTETTILSFSAPYIYFDGNGGVVNPDGKAFKGAWVKRRIAEFLPENYEPPQSVFTTTDTTK
ncbi:MAG: carboxypeptidase-like regulatory domain-containing protein, partial [Mucilaginibacter sp.]